ncbi:MAG TPA: hypothetical protein DIT33_23205 [Pseudomonas sp.]|nr:hypothetical protein [Pseudomonas sp.]
MTLWSYDADIINIINTTFLKYMLLMMQLAFPSPFAAVRLFNKWRKTFLHNGNITRIKFFR